MEVMNESVARRKIREAVESRGYTVHDARVELESEQAGAERDEWKAIAGGIAGADDELLDAIRVRAEAAERALQEARQALALIAAIEPAADDRLCRAQFANARNLARRVLDTTPPEREQ